MKGVKAILLQDVQISSWLRRQIVHHPLYNSIRVHQSSGKQPQTALCSRPFHLLQWEDVVLWTHCGVLKAPNFYPLSDWFPFLVTKKLKFDFAQFAVIKQWISLGRVDHYSFSHTIVIEHPPYYSTNDLPTKTGTLSWCGQCYLSPSLNHPRTESCTEAGSDSGGVIRASQALAPSTTHRCVCIEWREWQ